MAKAKKTEQDHILKAQEAIITAALPHVDFDGWSDTTLHAAIADSNVNAGLAKQAFPRGAVDLALGFHRLGDTKMETALATADMTDMRFRDKVIYAIRLRIEAVTDNKEAVRRGVTLFSLPMNAGEGAQALWTTADRIWNALGDTSEDVNWYTKRATLSAVYSSTVLFWLGDNSENNTNTWAFLDRRIENVMQFETLKTKLKDNPLAKGIASLFPNIQKPRQTSSDDLPGKTETT